MIRPVKPRILGPAARAGEGQSEYAPIDIVLATHGAFSTPVWTCPTCKRVRPQSMDGCKGDVAIEPHPLVARTPLFNTVIMAFEITGEERQRIINGEDVYVALLTFGHPQQPIMVGVGPEEMAAIHGLRVDSRLAGDVQMDCGGCGPGCECHPAEGPEHKHECPDCRMARQVGELSHQGQCVCWCGAVSTPNTAWALPVEQHSDGAPTHLGKDDGKPINDL